MRPRELVSALVELLPEHNATEQQIDAWLQAASSVLRVAYDVGAPAPPRESRIANREPRTEEPQAAAPPPPRPKRTPGPATAPRRARRSFSTEEKQEGARLYRELGPAAAAKRLDVVQSLLRTWNIQYPAMPEAPSNGGTSPADAQPSVVRPTFPSASPGTRHPVDHDAARARAVEAL